MKAAFGIPLASLPWVVSLVASTTSAQGTAPRTVFGSAPHVALPKSECAAHAPGVPAHAQDDGATPSRDDSTRTVEAASDQLDAWAPDRWVALEPERWQWVGIRDESIRGTDAIFTASALRQSHVSRAGEIALTGLVQSATQGTGRRRKGGQASVACVLLGTPGQLKAIPRDPGATPRLLALVDGMGCVVEIERPGSEDELRFVRPEDESIAASALLFKIPEGGELQLVHASSERIAFTVSESKRATIRKRFQTGLYAGPLLDPKLVVGPRDPVEQLGNGLTFKLVADRAVGTRDSILFRALLDGPNVTKSNGGITYWMHDPDGLHFLGHHTLEGNSAIDLGAMNLGQVVRLGVLGDGTCAIYSNGGVVRGRPGQLSAVEARFGPSGDAKRCQLMEDGFFVEEHVNGMVLLGGPNTRPTPMVVGKEAKLAQLTNRAIAFYTDPLGSEVRIVRRQGPGFVLSAGKQIEIDGSKRAISSIELHALSSSQALFSVSAEGSFGVEQQHVTYLVELGES